MADTVIDWAAVEAACAALGNDGAWKKPDLAVICGSGLSGLAEDFDEVRSVGYASVDLLGESTVKGHDSRIFLGTHTGDSGKQATVLFFQGRRHYYEGQGFAPIAFPPAFANWLGCNRLLITAAAGSLSQEFIGYRGIARIVDHIDLFFPNPLVGPPPHNRDRFIATADKYNGSLGMQVAAAIENEGVCLREGVYAAVTGPNYESGAVARMLSGHADFVGMSTVPEALIASALGFDFAGVVSVTNESGMSDNEHGEIKEVAVDIMPSLKNVIARVADRIVAGE